MAIDPIRYRRKDGTLVERWRVRRPGDRKGVGIFDTREEAERENAIAHDYAPALISTFSLWSRVARLTPIDPWPDDPGVYFVTLAGEITDRIKIGMASSVRARLLTAQTFAPHKLVLLAVVPGGRDQEDALHSRFYAERVQGEWFRFSPGLVDLLEELEAIRIGP